MNKEQMESEGLSYITMPMCDRTVNHEAAGEFIIPDYQPELRRLLNISERILPPAKYVSGSGVECNGTVDYRILYIGADGGLYSTSTSSEYEMNLPIEDGGEFELSEGSGVTVQTVCEGTTARVTSPRKINLRSRLRSHVRAYGKMNMTESVYGEAEGVERLYRQTENSDIATTGSDVIELEAEIGGMGDDVRVISADAGVFIDGTRMTEGGISVNGDVELRLLTCRDDGEVRPITKKISFDGEADGSGSDGMCRVMGSVTDITVNVEDGRILCNISLVLDALTANNRTVRYTADMYSTQRECECSTEKLNIPMVISCVNGNFSQSERISVSEAGIPEGARIIDAWGKIDFNGCECSEGKYIFLGKSKYFILCEREGEYSVCELELPVRYETVGDMCNQFTYDAFGEIMSCRARAEGDTLAIDSEIAVCGDIFGETEAQIVREVRFGEPYEKQRSRMVIYYPAEGESEWDVAKKYHVPAQTLTAEKHYYTF